jgi:predicted phosphodiesterase
VIERFGLIGDVHSQDVALRATIAYLKREGIQSFLCVGDILDGPGDPNRTIALLREHRVTTVAGNHDRWVIGDTLRDLPDATPRRRIDAAHISWLASLPATEDIPTCDGLALLCHGTGKNDMLGVKPDDEGYALEANLELTQLLVAKKYRYVLAGHTHRRMVRQFGELTLVNAGTLHPGYDPIFGLVDLPAGFVRFYDVRNPARIVLAEQLPLGSDRPAKRP